MSNSNTRNPSIPDNDANDANVPGAILDAFAVSVSSPPTYADLAPWLARYPQYARALTDYAAAWMLASVFDPMPDGELTSDPARVARGIAIARKAMAAAAPLPITSLVMAAQQTGQGPADLAARVKITMTIFAKLDRRLLRAATIPERLIDDLAVAVGRGAEAVRMYLQGDATLPAGAMYSAASPPSVRRGEGKEDFFDAIASDETMDAEDRAAWLALAPPSDAAS